jgi:hypothetical protein
MLLSDGWLLGWWLWTLPRYWYVSDTVDHLEKGRAGGYAASSTKGLASPHDASGMLASLTFSGSACVVTSRVGLLMV